MTSILSIATPYFVAQVADRRLTFVDGTGNARLVDDNANKLTLFCNRMAFGYTGLAHIGRQRTDVWLSDLLGKFSGANLTEAIMELKQEATAAFSKLPYSSKLKRHAFVGVGWACTDAAQLEFKPSICQISNFHSKDGRVLDSANNEFGLGSVIYTPPQWGWMEVGAYMYPREVARLTRLLSRAARKEATTISAVRLMVRAIRAINERGDKTVGKNLLAVIMPIGVAAAPSVHVLMGGGAGIHIGEGDPDFRNAPNIFSAYFRDGESDGNIYAPNVVCKGSVATNVRSGPH